MTIDWQAEVAKSQQWLRTVIRTRVGEPQAVDEVLQEVLLAAIAQRAPVADPCKLPAWLYRLAVRQTLLYRRKQGRQRKLTGRYAQRLGAGNGNGRHAEGDPLDWLLADERRRQVRTALERLAPRDREALLLKYEESWSYRQIAERLGVSESAVESRLHRARGALRRELADDTGE